MSGTAQRAYTVSNPGVGGNNYNTTTADQTYTTTVNHTAADDLDQSTVNSPTHGEHYSEKRYQQGGAATGKDAKMASYMERIGAGRFTTWGLRALQFIFGAITLALASHSLNKFYRRGNIMRYTVFCASMTLIYLFALFCVSFFMPSFLVAGALMITEAVLCLLWLASFIGVAAKYAGYHCKRSNRSGYSQYGDYNWHSTTYIPYNASSSRIRGCRSGKAASAFAAFSFFLFLLSSLLIWYNVIRKLRRRNANANYLFDTNAVNGNRGYLDKTGLAFAPGFDPEVNTQTAYDGYSGDYDTHTAGAGVGDEYNAGTNANAVNNGAYTNTANYTEAPYANTANAGNAGRPADGYQRAGAV